MLHFFDKEAGKGSTLSDQDRQYLKLLTRKHIVFHGEVQGVGFRYTAYHLASRLGLTGWVRNEYDGTVTCEIQGKREDLMEFLDEIQNQRYISIDYMEQKNMASVMESSFRVIGY